MGSTAHEWLEPHALHISSSLDSLEAQLQSFSLCLPPVCFRRSLDPWFHSQSRCYCQLCPNILHEDAPLWLLALAGNSTADVRMRTQGQDNSGKHIT